MVYKTLRHKIYIAALIFFVFITFACNNDLWKMWLVLPITIGTLYLAGRQCLADIFRLNVHGR